MSFEQFDRYWDGTHGALVVSIPEFTRHVRRYSQAHIVDPTYDGAGMAWKRADYDGIAEVWFDDPTAMSTAFNEPQFMAQIAPDDEKFVDAVHTQLFTLREIEKLPGTNTMYSR